MKRRQFIFYGLFIATASRVVQDSRSHFSQTLAVQKPKINSSDSSLEIAMIPWSIPADQDKKLQPLADYLTNKLGRPIRFTITKDYNAAIHLLVSGEVELALLGALSYVEAYFHDLQIQPIVAPIDQLTKRPWYTSVIIGNRHQGIKSLEDLKGKRFAFVSELSTSGYLVPIAHFKAISFIPEQDFAQVSFAGGHDKVKEMLLTGEVDAIADDSRSYLTALRHNKINRDQYAVIWESDPIPNIPLVASRQVSPNLILKLKKAFLDAPEGLIDFSGSPGAGYTLVEDEDYEQIRKIIQRIQAN